MSVSPLNVSIVPPGQLVYGMQLPVQAQSTYFAEPWEAGAGPAELAQATRACDEAGFFYVAVCDHVAIPRDYAKRMSTVWYDTIATLAWLAAQTTRVRLLSHVYVLAYRHPLVAAKAFATLDALSGGRVICGVGAGHVEPEFEELGVPFEGRGALLDEALVLFESALRSEYPPEAKNDVGVAPRPVQQPRPPIWIGGSSPAAVRRAARYDGWLPQGTPRAELPALISLLRETRTNPDPCDIGTITEWIHVGEPIWDLGRPCLTGSPEQLAESLREYAAMGVGHLQVRFPSRSAAELCDQIASFGEQVGPLLGS